MLNSRLPIAQPPAEPVLSLNVQAKMLPTEPEEPVQFKILVRHFLERFFNNEMASSDGEGKKHLIQIACIVGLPGFIMALYLYPTYHDVRAHRPYWAQVGDHYFYVMYSLVAMGVVTIFEWDFFFPDLLDVFVLTSLPVKNRKLFLARIAAVAIFVSGFLFDANFLAPLVLPAATDPPHLMRFFISHLLAVAMSGTFAAAFVLALQGVLLGILGERIFRRISLLLQSLSITTLLTLLLFYPALSGTIQGWMNAKSTVVLYLPPFWFLGIYQRLLEGPSVLPVFSRLAQMGCIATALMIATAILSYPFAYWRRTRQLVVGSGKSDTRSWLNTPIRTALHATVIDDPASRAIWHFISQTLLRVQRYRMYLIMYGGLGIALIVAYAVRFNFSHGEIRCVFSSDGLRAAVPIAAFWTIAGLRMCFLSPADQRGNWMFRVILGKPGLEQFTTTKRWVLLWAITLSLGTIALTYSIAPPDLSSLKASLVQALVAIGLCLLLTDIFFLKVRIIPFTGKRAATTTNLAIVLLPYIAFFKPLISLTVGLEPWLEASFGHILIAASAITVLHLGIRKLDRRMVAEYANQTDLDDDEEEFPQKLGLRY